MREWLDGAKIHPGWLPALVFCLMCILAAKDTPRPWVGAIGLAWFIPVVLTCRSVSRANRIRGADGNKLR